VSGASLALRRRRALAASAAALVVNAAVAVTVIASPPAAAQTTPTPAAAPAEADLVFDTVTWPRPGLDASFDAEWHLPQAAPARGLVLLHHGFARRCANLRGTAAALASAGWAVLCFDTDMSRGNPELADEWAAALRAGRVTLPDRSPLPTPWVVAGHSAGGLFAALLGAALVRTEASPLAGTLLFDPVSTRGPRFAEALQALSDAGRPILSLNARPGPCNADGRGRDALQALQDQRGADQVRLLDLGTRSTHVDVEADDTDALAVTVCRQGAPQAEVVAQLREESVTFLRRVGRPIPPRVPQ
jgi:hypothetical protein